MLIALIISAVLLGVLLLLAIGFYLGWFNLDPGGAGSIASRTLSLNDKNIKAVEGNMKDTSASANE